MPLKNSDTDHRSRQGALPLLKPNVLLKRRRYPGGSFGGTPAGPDGGGESCIAAEAEAIPWRFIRGGDLHLLTLRGWCRGKEEALLRGVNVDMNGDSIFGGRGVEERRYSLTDRRSAGCLDEWRKYYCGMLTWIGTMILTWVACKLGRR